MRKLLRSITPLLVFLPFAGCSYNAVQHDVQELVATDYGELVEPGVTRMVSEAELLWWQRFEMPELNAFLEELGQANYDLEVARQRVVRARALLGGQRAGNWPTVDLSTGGTRTITERQASGQSRSSRNDQLAFSAAYEVDFWGRRAAANHASAMGVVVEEARLRSTALSLQAELAQRYFEWLSLGDRMRTVEANIQATKDLLRLVELRVEAGRASGIELEQQRIILLGQEAQLPALDRDRQLAERAIAILLGRDRLLLVETEAELEDVTIPVVGALQPAALLESRPDIRVAEAELKIQDAVLYQTRAKRWPSLSLSADAALAEMTVGPQWTASLVGRLVAPLFNGGRIKNEIQAAEADVSIALLTYRSTVIQALREVLDSLTDLNHQRAIYRVRGDELVSSSRLIDLTRRRFEAGNLDFLNLLVAQRNQFDAQERMIGAKRDYLTAVVNAFRAMGVPPQLLTPTDDWASVAPARAASPTAGSATTSRATSAVSTTSPAGPAGE